MSSSTPAMNIVNNGSLRRLSTVGSTGMPAIDEEREHKQDWTVTTDEKDSWAVRERRRSSIWSKIEMVPSTSPKSGARRGSILSMWQGGKDKDGKDIVIHDDHDSDEEEGSVGSPSSPTFDQEKRVRERRPSILSMWKPGKDEHGRDAIHHDDEEWKF